MLLCKNVSMATSHATHHGACHGPDRSQSRRGPRHDWRIPTLITLGAVLGVLGLFWDTAGTMVTTWQHSADFGYGFLVVPLSLYLLWCRRLRVAALHPAPSYGGLLILLALGGGWLLGHLADVLLVQQLAVVAMPLGLVWTVLGTAVTRAVLAPLAFLIFAVPLGDGLGPLLQDWTAFFTVTALRLSGIPVWHEGRWLATPMTTWHVAEACSGLRYVLPAMVLGCFYATVTYQCWPRRLVLVLTSIGVSMLANGIRAYGLVLLTSLGKTVPGADRAAEVVHYLWAHEVYGGLVFGAMMAMIFWLGQGWREPADDAAPSRGAGLAPSSGMAHDRACPYFTRQLVLTAACAIAIAACAPLLAQAFTPRALPAVIAQATAPIVRPPWQALAEFPEDWTPSSRVASIETRRSYIASGRAVHLYMAYYARQREGAEVINAGNDVAEGRHWIRLAEGRAWVTIDGHMGHVCDIRMRSLTGENRLVWYWYGVAGQWTCNPYWAKLLQLKARLLGEPQDATVIALATADPGPRAEGAQILQDFLGHLSLLPTHQHFENLWQ